MPPYVRTAYDNKNSAVLADVDTSSDVTASSTEAIATVGITAGPQAGLSQDFEITGLVAGVGALGLLILLILLVMLLRKKRKRRKRNQQVKKIESSASLDNLDDDDGSEMRMQKSYAQESAHSIMSRPSHPRAHGPQPAGVPYGGNVDRGHAYPGHMYYY